MRISQCKVPAERSFTTNTFGGYRHVESPLVGEWYHMKNLSSRHYPALATRAPRELVTSGEEITALFRGEGLSYIDGTALVLNGARIEVGLNEEKPKKLARMGAYLIILPDKRYVNLADLSDFGEIEACFESEGEVALSPSFYDGTDYDRVVISPTSPAAPTEEEGVVAWIDTSGSTPVLCEYSAALGTFVSMDSPYLKIRASGIGAAFLAGDSVRIRNFLSLDGYYRVSACSENELVIAGAVIAESGAQGITVERRMPKMDFITEAGNRLWGCRYGVSDEGEIVNEIYASAAGDFRNWHTYENTAADSFVTGVGSDGPFTGAATYLGQPLFFKEHFLHRVSGAYPAAYRVNSTPCDGVKKGSERSLVQLGDTLYYHADGGVFAYDGSLPTCVSASLGEMRFAQAVAGAIGDRYYLSVREEGGARHLFVFDRAKGLWHREDDVEALDFCPSGGKLYLLAAGGKIFALDADEGEERVAFLAESGPIGVGDPHERHLLRLHLRMALAKGARVRVLLEYDSDGVFHTVTSLRGKSLGSSRVVIRPRRCDHFRLRFEGEGDWRLLSLTRFETKGGELS